MVIIRKQRFQVLVKVYEGSKLDNIEQWIQDTIGALTIFEKVLKRLDKRKNNNLFFVKELHKFFEGLELDLYCKDDNETMHSMNIIIDQYLAIFRGVKTKEDLQQVFYQKEEIQIILSQEEEIQSFARELISFRDRQQEILEGFKILDFK